MTADGVYFDHADYLGVIGGVEYPFWILIPSHSNGHHSDWTGSHFLSWTALEKRLTRIRTTGQKTQILSPSQTWMYTLTWSALRCYELHPGSFSVQFGQMAGTLPVVLG